MADLVDRVSTSVKVLREPDLYQMILRVYLPILFPLTFLISLAAIKLDAFIGWTQLLPSPSNYIVAAVLLGTGAVLWLATYATLVFGGDGSPAPVVRRTQKLVTWGIYAYCRNPSIHGKLLGFIAVGVVINSPSFVFVLAPVILTLSLIEKIVRQEPQLIEVFGDDYLEYRERVPLFLPLPRLYRWWRRKRSQGTGAA